MKKTVRYLCLILILATAACSEDPTYENTTQTQYRNSHRTSTFNLPYMWDISEVKDIKISLIHVDGEKILNLDGKCEAAAEGQLKVTMIIPNDTGIPDGLYALSAKLADKLFTPRYIATFEQERLTSVSESDFYSGLTGSGTSESPYQITDNSTFNQFLYGLSQDPTHACGLYFSQKNDIDWTLLQINKNRGLASEIFAGHYDGGGKSINSLSYTGGNNATEDVNVGLFSQLSNGAVIKKLDVNMTISYATDCAGIIAGSSSGTVSIDSVTISGSIIQCGSNAGGFIGKTEGNTTITDCYSNVNVNATGDNIGGVIGNHGSGLLSINSFSTVKGKANFSVAGGNNVGGIVGNISSSSYNITNAELNHSTDAENANIIGVYATGDCAGGIIGNVSSVSAESTISSSTIILPVKADVNNAGGLIGKITAGQHIIFSGNCYSGVAHAKTSAGGVAGHADFSGYAPTIQNVTIKGENNSASQITALECAGGLFGQFKSTASETVTLDGVTVMTNVTISGEGAQGKAGGIAGQITDSRIDVSGATVGNGSMYIMSPSKAGGLVGELNNSTLTSNNTFDFWDGSKNRIPSSSSFTPDFSGTIRAADAGTSTSYMGGAVGCVTSSTIKGLHIKATVTGTGNYTGGIFGHVTFTNDIRIEDCTSVSTVSGANYTGGIAGETSKNGRFQDCINYGTVTGVNYVGGIVGKMYFEYDEPYVYYCVNTGAVSGNTDIGGITGLMSSDDKDVSSWCKIDRCGNYGSVTSSGDSEYAGTGGILGRCPNEKGAVLRCANHGKVYAGKSSSVGGIAGKMGKDAGMVYAQQSNLELAYCANSGEISSGSGDSHVGGILGYQEEGNKETTTADGDFSTLHNCYNSGPVTSDQDDDTGGIVGYVDYEAYVSYCINYGTVSHGNGTIGTHKGAYRYYRLMVLEGSWNAKKLWPGDVNEFSSAEMGKQSTYSGFDFTAKWKMSGGKAILQDCPFQDVARPTE